MSNEAHEKGIEAADKTYHDSSFDDHSKDMERAIKAYLDASGLVLVPREPTDMMRAKANKYLNEPYNSEFGNDFWRNMISGLPNPFESKQDE